MKRRFNSIPIILFSFLAGLIGLGLQLWLQQAGTDESGLLLPGHTATYLLLGLSVCTVLILFYISTGVPKDMQYRELASTRKCSAFGSLVGVLGVVITVFYKNLPYALTIACLFVVVLLLWQLYVQKDKVLRFWSCCGITVFLLILPLVQYPIWCIETQLQAYIYPLFASLCLLLAAYHRTEAELGLYHGKRIVFFHTAAVYFGVVSTTTELGIMLCGFALWCAFDLLRLHPVIHIRMPLPETVAECIRTLTSAGFPAYAVGGCVRDTQLGEPVHDYDLCTSATPDQIAEVFSQYKLVRTGEKHGTVGVIIDDVVWSPLWMIWKKILRAGILPSTLWLIPPSAVCKTPITVLPT